MSVQTLSGQRLIVASDGTLELSADDAEPTRIALAFEAGRDGFWLARWLRARGVEAHVIHASSVAVSREHRRAKTDRLDTELLTDRAPAAIKSALLSDRYGEARSPFRAGIDKATRL